MTATRAARGRTVMAVVMAVITVVAPVAPAVGAGTGSTVATTTGPAGALPAGTLDATGPGPRAGAVGDANVRQVSTTATVSGCTRIDSAGVYRLDRDVPGRVGPSETCIAINASNVTVDGDGYALVGNDSGTAVGVVRSGLSNVTVRAVGVGNYSTGIRVNDTDRSAVRNVTVQGVTGGVVLRGSTGAVGEDLEIVHRESSGFSISVGIDASDSVGTVLRDIRVRTRATSFAAGVSVSTARDVVVRNVSLAGRDGSTNAIGINGRLASGLTLETVVADRYTVGVDVARANRTAVRNATVRNVTQAVLATAPGGTGQTTAVESATLTNVSVADVSAGQSGRQPAYLAVDGSNNVTARNVSTPNATIASVTGRNVTLAPVTATPAAPRSVTVGRVNVTELGAAPAATVGVRYNDSAVSESSVGLYERAGSSWSQLPAGNTSIDTANDTATLQVGAGNTYGAFADQAAITDCRRLDRAGGYEVTGNLTATVPPGAACLAINASNVTVDGNGYALAGNGTGTGVGVVRSGLANVTVRNLTVRDHSVGVALNDTIGATGRDLRTAGVETAIDAESTTGVTLAEVAAGDRTVRFGVDLEFADGASLVNATFRRADTLLTGGTAVDGPGADDLTVRNVTVGQSFGTGLGLSFTERATLRNVTVGGGSAAIDAVGARELDARDVRTDNTTVVIDFVVGRDRTVNVESGTVRNLTVRGADTYVVADRSNDVTVRRLRTTAGTIRRASVRNASLGPPRSPPAAQPDDVELGQFGVTNRSDNASVRVEVGYDPDRVRASTLALYEATDGNWSTAGLTDPQSTTGRNETTETFGATLAGSDANGTVGVFASDRGIDGCTRITDAGVYDLTGNATAALQRTDRCIAIDASNVTVDGNGYTLAGNGSGVAVARGGPGLTNVTVRNLTVRNWTSGVDLFDTAAPTVRNVTVRATRVDGVDISDSENASLADVRVRTEATRAVSGLVASGSRNATLESVTVTGAAGGTRGPGVKARNASSLTVDGLDVARYATGVAIPEADGLAVANASLRNVTLGVNATVAGGDGQTAAVESATLEDVTFGPLAASSGLARGYVRVDGSNDVTLRNVTTPNATLKRATAENVSLVPVGATPAPPQNVTVGTVAIDTLGVGPTASVGFGYEPIRVNESSIGLYDLGFPSWSAVPAGDATVDAANDTATVQVSGGGTYGAFADRPTLSGCRLIDEPGAYDLTGPIRNDTARFCLSIDASDVRIDGNGYAVVGNGTGTAVGVGSGNTNVTVRNLTVRNWSIAAGTGADGTAFRSVTIRDVATGVVVGGDGTTLQSVAIRDVQTGVDIETRTFNVRLTNATIVTESGPVETFGVRGRVAGGLELSDVEVRTRSTGEGSIGVSFINSRQVRLSNVTVRADAANATTRPGATATRNLTLGIGATQAENTTIERTTVDGYAIGITGRSADGLAIRSSNVRNATLGVGFTLSPTGNQRDRESGTLENVTLGPVSGSTNLTTYVQPAAYLAVDGTNDVTLSNVSTPNATLARFTGENVSLTEVGATPAPPQPVSIGAVNVSDRGSAPTASVGFGYDGTAVNESSIGLYELGFPSWSPVPDAQSTVDPANDTATVEVIDAGTYGAFADASQAGTCTRIDQPGVYDLGGPATVATGGTCIAINVSDVVVDGNGHTLAGTGSGTGVGVVRSGLANVTVRNLTVRNVSSGVDLNGTDRATVGNVAVRATGVNGVSLSGATDAVARDVLATPTDGATPFTDGIDVSDSVDTRVVDVRVRAQTESLSSGVAVLGSENATLRNVTVTSVEPQTIGFAVWGATSGPPDTTNLTIDGLRVDSYQHGVTLARATGVTVRNASIRNVSRGITIAETDGDRTQVVESVEFTNVSFGDLRAGFTAGRLAYLNVDGSSDVTGRTVSTPNATLARFTGGNVSLTEVGATPAPPQNVTVGRVAIEDIGTAPSASVGVRYNESAVRESSVGLYERAGSSWQSVPAGTVTLDTATDTATVQIGANGTYGAFADENGSAPSLPLGERLFPNGLPASSTGDPPTDVDGDGTLEDMDGNGRFQFTDVIEFVFSQQRGDYASLTTAQSDALDLDGNGRVTFVDVIDLVFELQAS